MRWFVEVNSIGKSEKQSYCVAADTWQRALQFARGLRADNGPMTGFSIELLDEGFSAVDPMARLRYRVRRAPDDAPLTEVPETMGTPTTPTSVPGSTRPPSSARGSSPPPSTPPSADTTRELPNPASSPHPAADPTTVTPSFAAMLAAPPTEVAPAPSSIRPPASVRPPTSQRSPSSPGSQRPRGSNVRSSRPPPVERRPSSPSSAAMRVATPAPVAGLELIFKREQEPDSRAPLTYREYVYRVAPGTDGETAKSLLVAQFEMVRLSLASSPPGRLVNLAIFDVEFTGKPHLPPLVTLMWKDWRGDAVVELPRTAARSTAPQAPSQGPERAAPAAPPPPSPSAHPPQQVAQAVSPSQAPHAPSQSRQPVAPSQPPQPPSQSRQPVAPSQAPPQAPPPPSQSRQPVAAVQPSQPPSQARQPVASAPPPSPSRPPPSPASIAPATDVVATKPAAQSPSEAPHPLSQPPTVAAPPPPMAIAGATDTLPSAQAQAMAQTLDARREVSLPVAVAIVDAQQQPATARSNPPAARPASAPPPQAPPPQAPPPQASPPSSRRRDSVPPSQRANGPRMRGDELITDLFEAMHDLHFLRDTVEGADFCLTLALEKMPSRAGLVHLYDIDKRQFVVTCARGPGAEALLMRRHPESDPLIRAAMRKQRATVIADARTGDASQAERYRVLGGAKSAVVAPVMLAGRFLGAIELLDPADGAPFTDNEGHALSYIGEQFGEFVATRGVVLDPERLVPRQAAAR